jgi:hypothetical protein
VAAPRHLASVDLRAEAERERERLLTARALIDAGPMESGLRAPLCVIHRREGGRRGRFWVWKVAVADGEGAPAWEWLLALHAPAARVAATAGAARTLLLPDDTLEEAADLAAGRGLGPIAGDMERYGAACAGRELAIVGALRTSSARLAAALLQPGLFDRRAERAAAAQAALLEEALARSAARSRWLDALRRPRVDERTLVFAVALQ